MTQNQQNQPQALTICNPPGRRPQRQQKCPPLFDLTPCVKRLCILTRVSRAKKGRCTVPTNPICVVGNSWMRAEIESNSTKMRKACVEVTQAFRDFSLLLVEAIASLRKKTRFFTIHFIAWCPAVSSAVCGISWSRSWLPYFLPSLLPNIDTTRYPNDQGTAWHYYKINPI